MAYTQRGQQLHHLRVCVCVCVCVSHRPYDSSGEAGRLRTDLLVPAIGAEDVDNDINMLL